MTKNKHDHTATKKIKAWLFAIMLLLPFLFLLPTGLYYGLNQNAQLSERTVQTPVYYESNDVETIDDLVVGNIYELNYVASEYTLSSNITLCDDIVIISGSYTGIGYVINNVSARRPYIEFNSNQYVYDYREIGTDVYARYWSSVRLVFVFRQTSNSNIPLDIISSTDYQLIKEYTDITYTNDISTSIINAWNSTWQNPLFSWTNYSPFYTPMQSFTNVFGINNMQIANVLTYLATITAIYIVFDIIIELFTYLTHLIPRSD